MRVLYVLKRYPRLSETFVVREIVCLEARGVGVGIDALLPPEDGPRHPATGDVGASVRYVPRRPRLRRRPVAAAHLRLVLVHPGRWAREAVRALRAGTWRRFLQAGLVARRAMREDFDSLHAHFATAAAEVAAHAAALSGLPFTVTAHAKDIYSEQNAPLLARRVGRADAVVTVSHHNEHHLRDRLPGVRLDVIRNGVPLGPATGPSADGPLLCVARLVEKKGIDLLLGALAELAARGRTVRLTLVGDGPLRAELEEMADGLGVAASVQFVGAQPSTEVDRAYRQASMVVLPCRVAGDGDRDGLPTVLVEALARALPVVTTDVVGIGELVRDGSTGLLVPPEDPGALADAIARLLDDPALAVRLGQEGRRLVEREYDPSRSAAQLQRLLMEVTR